MTIANKLNKYPHLASQPLIDHLKSEISRLEGLS